MKVFLELINFHQGLRIVDLGGTASLWRPLDADFHVTLVNLPSASHGKTLPNSSRFTYVHADACELGGVFADQTFDLVFSNATIEHVGDEARQEAFAREVRRWLLPTGSRHPVIASRSSRIA